MVPKRFVVPLDGSDFALRAARFAERWMTAFDAQVVAFTTTDGTTEIVNATLERPNSWLCMAVHPHRTLGRDVLAPLVRDVLRRISVPAIVIGPKTAFVDEGPVVVCHDGTTFADAALEPATTWAAHLEIPTRLAHAIHPLDDNAPSSTPEATRHAAARLGTEPLICRGPSPTAALLDMTDRVRPSMVALTTHARGRIASLIFESVVTGLVASSTCPVLVARPIATDTRGRLSARFPATGAATGIEHQ